LAEAVADELERAGVVLEVPVVDRNADAVHAQPGQQLRVILAEERGEQAVEEQLVPVLAENRADGAAHQRLIRRVAGDEVLHVHPAAEAGTPQPDRHAVPVDEAIALGTQETVPGSHNPLLPRRRAGDHAATARSVIRRAVRRWPEFSETSGNSCTFI